MWIIQAILMLASGAVVVSVVLAVLYFAREQIGEAPAKVCDDVEAYAIGCGIIKEPPAARDPFSEIGGEYSRGSVDIKRRRGG